MKKPVAGKAHRKNCRCGMCRERQHRQAAAAAQRTLFAIDFDALMQRVCDELERRDRERKRMAQSRRSLYVPPPRYAKK